MEAFFAYFGFITVTKLRIPAELCKNPLKKSASAPGKEEDPKVKLTFGVKWNLLLHNAL
jgi:hypothetical protein